MRLHTRSQRERFPIAAGLELTFRCNLACIHCYVNLPAADREAKSRELDTDGWRRVLDQCADAGVLWLTLTGGEPLLRPDFCEIYEHAHERGLVLTVYTNATLVTERHLGDVDAMPAARARDHPVRLDARDLRSRSSTRAGSST